MNRITADRCHPARAAAGGRRRVSRRGVALLLTVLFGGAAGAEPAPADDAGGLRPAVVYEAGIHSKPTFRRSLGYTLHHGESIAKQDKSGKHARHADKASGRLPRPWVPVDLAVAPNGELWLIQRLQRSPGFDDVDECPVDETRPHDCEALLGSTVTLREPQAGPPASASNGRATLTIDFNAWHFMRRPTAIAFGARQIWLEPDDPGAMHGKQRLLKKRVAFTDTFATCAEHNTANFTDQPFFIGPTLWTADPAIYNGANGTYDWSNGAHLDMLHGTAYCMGLAWERDTRYWAFNGKFGTLDHYDFGAPHFPGHYYHANSTVDRYRFGETPLARLPDVPSNMVLSGNTLFIADSGNGRLVAFDTTAKGRFVELHHSLPPELQRIQVLEGVPLRDIAARQTLAKLWGEQVAPSGLAQLDKRTLALANHASGHITLIDVDGKVLRTIDTGLGKGIGGMTSRDGVLYFAHMEKRKVYRLDLR